MPGGVKSRGGRCVSQVWHFTFGSRGEIFLDFEEPFCQKLCGKQYNGDYKSLDLEKGCNKKKEKEEKGGGLQTALDCMGTFYGIIPAEWYRYYVGRSRQGDFEAFIVKAELSARRRGISGTTDITDRIKARTSISFS